MSKSSAKFLVLVLLIETATAQAEVIEQHYDWWVFAVPAIVTLIVFLSLLAGLIHLRRRPITTHGQNAILHRHATLIDVASKTQHPIRNVPWRVGRSRANALTINDSSISRVHAEIRQNADGAYELHDLDSLNGVYVNETRVIQRQLAHQDIVDFGEVRFEFVLQSE